MFCPGGKTPDPSQLKNVRTYVDVMQEQDLRRDQVYTNIVTYAIVFDRLKFESTWDTLFVTVNR